MRQAVQTTIEWPLTIQPRPNRLPRLADQNTRIVIEPNHTPILPLQLLRRPHHDRMLQVPSLDLVGRNGGNPAAAAAASGTFAKGALLLHDDDYSIAWAGLGVESRVCVGTVVM